jgi:hypothetical protein
MLISLHFSYVAPQMKVDNSPSLQPEKREERQRLGSQDPALLDKTKPREEERTSTNRPRGFFIFGNKKKLREMQMR